MLPSYHINMTDIITFIGRTLESTKRSAIERH
jgi:hypothetical protein